jgi:hypothetical protein
MILLGSSLLYKINLMFSALPNNQEAVAPPAAWLPFDHRQPFSSIAQLNQYQIGLSPFTKISQNKIWLVCVIKTALY